MQIVSSTSTTVKPIPASVAAWFAARGYTLDPVTGKATPIAKPAPPTDYFTQRAERKARMKARRDEATKAMRLYSIDHAAARRGERDYPRVVDYTTWTWADGPREMVATDYAKSRFHELPKKPAKHGKVAA